MEENKFSVLPSHVGIIMDGNGRWAKQRNLPRNEGHRQGAKTFRKIGEYAGNLGIKFITFYAFSTENWSRPENEVDAIMELFGEYLTEAIERLDENREKGIRLRFIGDRSALPEALVSLMDYVEKATADMNKITLNLAINYGGRQEILRSVQSVAEKVKNGELLPENITLESISEGLYTSGQPDADLIIRPSGELRLSNFLLWQSAYSEFWFSDILWPDFTEGDFDNALAAFEKRQRRFGGL